jgi:hypothetical protein
MRARVWLCSFGMAVALAVAGSAIVACGTPTAKFPQVKAQEMPSGESWDGVYYNPVYGYLHLVPQGDNVVGRWKRTDSSHWGELSGTVEGNLFHFTWKEHRYGAIGPSGDTHGSGQFVYKRSEGDKVVPELDGWYAIDESEKIGDWHCVKQQNMKPDLNTINGESPTDPAAKQDQWQ